jgi:type II secretory pathway pseudopilin PulG
MRTLKQNPTRMKTRTIGFTLFELTVSLFVIALLLASVLTPLQTQVEERKFEETKRLLEEARESLLGYAAANGYFPCPADSASNGQEAIGTNHNTGACPVWQGFVPAAVLGLTSMDVQGYAIDAWGVPANRIRYAVSNHTIAGTTNPFTRMNGLRSVPMSSLAVTPTLHICQSGVGVNPGTDCGGAVTLAANAAVVVWSVGANGATGGSSVHEAQNPNPNGGSTDRIFVSRSRSNVPGNEFDDVMTWIASTALLSRLVIAGQFTPAAHTAASPPP